MSIRLIIPPLHDLASITAGQPPDGDPAPARVRLTPRGLTGAVLVAGQPRIVAAETHVIPAKGLVVTLADPSAATPSGWHWQVLIDPERGQRAVGVVDPEITPGTLDGDDRVYQLAEVLAVSEAEAGVPVLVVKGPAGDKGAPGTTTWAGITDKPSIPDSPDDIGAAPTAHAHPIADVTGLQGALDGKQAAGSYAAATHTHGVTDLTATGTRDATTYLRGDGTWATPPGGGGASVLDNGDGTLTLAGTAITDNLDGTLTIGA